MNKKCNKDFLIKEYLEKGRSVSDIAKELNITVAALRTKLSRFGIKRELADVQSKLSNIDFLNNEYLVKNKSLRAIAEELSVSINTVARYVKKHGLKKTKSAKRKAKELTMKQRYGVKHPAQSDEIKEKTKKTNLIRYGCEYVGQSKEIQSKVKKSNLEKYGAESTLSVKEIRDKCKDTMISRYGVSYSGESKEILEKAINTCREKYGVDYAAENKIVRSRIKDTLIKKYGESSTFAVQEIAKRARDKMLDKYGVEFYPQSKSFKDKLIKTKLESGHLNHFDGKLLKDIAEEFNLPYTTLCAYQRNYNFEELDELINAVNNAKNSFTYIEQRLSELIGFDKFNKKVDLPSFKEIHYRPDFKISKNIFVNSDGLFWHSELNLDKYYHFNMRKAFEYHNKRIYQFREDEIVNKPEVVKSIIDNSLGRIINKVYARKTTFKVVSASDAKKFLTNNHLMGYSRAKSYGLYYNDQLVSLLSYKIFKGKVLKIERFASKIGTVVLGGLSKLLSNILNDNNDVEEIHSWVDLRYGNGYSLERVGFEKIKETLGWKWTDGKNTFNRLKCRANMDHRCLSEREYAKELGWYRIYDAGQRLYIKNLINNDK